MSLFCTAVVGGAGMRSSLKSVPVAVRPAHKRHVFTWSWLTLCLNKLFIDAGGRGSLRSIKLNNYY